MAILNNLREVRSWMDSASPHVVPSWQADLIMRKSSTTASTNGVVRAPPGLIATKNTSLPPETNKKILSIDSFFSKPSLPKGPPPLRPGMITASTTRPTQAFGARNREEQVLDHTSKLIPGASSKNPNPTRDASIALTQKEKAPTQAPAPAASQFDWSDDDLSALLEPPDKGGPHSDSMIDVSILHPQLKRSGNEEGFPAKRPRVITSTPDSQSPIVRTSTNPPAKTITNKGKPTVIQSISSSQAARGLGTSKPSASSKDTDISALHAYIFACEDKINLLSKCNAVSESTSLSLDAKKQWHTEKFVPKMKVIDKKVHALRSVFTFLNPLPTDLSDIYSDTPIPKTPSLCIVSSPTRESSPKSKRAWDCSIENERSSAYSESITTGTQPNLNNMTNNYDTNIEEARRVILERRSNPVMIPEPPEDIDEEGSEDNFGQEYMGGLQSSQVDDHETDLSGFIANDDDEANSVDGTYMFTQGTQFAHRVVETDDDEQSSISAHGDESLHDELDDIKLSQDVAARYGVAYEDPVSRVEVVELEDDDFDEEIQDFSTQLKEARDEEAEIVDCDLDDDDFNDIFPAIKPIIKTEANTINSSDHELSDDEDIFLLTRPNALQTQRKDPGHPHIPGSENFIDEVYAVLKNTFQLTSFRPNQLEAVVSTLMGKDVFVLIPTGGGKSLCYQLPALVTRGKTRGTTVVISPLISLMQDQIHHLKKRNIKAEMISSRGTAEEKSEVLRAFAAGNLSMVYLSPEMVNKAPSIRRILTKLYDNNLLARVVVDEAHCVSSWGHDFRPDYQDMSMFKQEYPNVPIMALTATANEKVRLDIVHNLRMHQAVTYKQSFNRTNLFYTVMKKPPNIFEWLRDYILQRHRSKTGIIYCHSKQSCENTSEKLQSYGVRCRFYHAGMDADERLKVQTEWQEDKIQVICATIAFGMGIDKPDVRFVVHIYIPRTLEGYYQETGRAGRDGRDSECVMFYAYKDARNLKVLIEKDRDLEYATKEMHLAKLRQVIQYCENATDCRRRQVLHYFNENFDAKLCNKKCDNCCSEVASVRRDVTDHCSKIVKLVQEIQNEKVTVIHCQDVYWGSKNSKIMKMGHCNSPYHGAGRELSKNDMERIFFYLQCENALMEYQVVRGGYATSYVKLGPNANSFMKANKRIEISFVSQKKTQTSTAPKLISSGPKLTPSGNGSGLANFRYQESFVSAREIRNQEDAEKENTYGRAPKSVSRIVLPQETFNGVINDSNRDLIEKAYNELRSVRMLKSQELGYARPAGFVSDALLKEMAIELPTNARDYAKLKNTTKDQTDMFVYFKKILTTLARQRKKATTQTNGPTQQEGATGDYNSTPIHSSPYFHQTQQSKKKSTNTQKSQSYGNKGGKKQRYESKRGTQKPASRATTKSNASSHIRQMPI